MSSNTLILVPDVEDVEDPEEDDEPERFDRDLVERAQVQADCSAGFVWLLVSSAVISVVRRGVYGVPLPYWPIALAPQLRAV